MQFCFHVICTKVLNLLLSDLNSYILAKYLNLSMCLLIMSHSCYNITSISCLFELDRNIRSTLNNTIRGFPILNRMAMMFTIKLIVIVFVIERKNVLTRNG